MPNQRAMGAIAATPAVEIVIDESTGALPVGAYVYQRLGAERGSVYVAADGSLATEGACKLDDVQKVSPVLVARAELTATQIAVATVDPIATDGVIQ